MPSSIEEYQAKHYIHRGNWLRAAVLGANDGILSTASIAIGVATATSQREPILLAALAGLVAGALSMASGEYVSVSSQKDLEMADIAREQQELIDMPEIELQRLAEIYEQRGLKKETARKVAEELTKHDALGSHIRDELGINDLNQAKPLQAAFTSAGAFTLGGLLPLLVCIFFPLAHLEYYLYASSLSFLVILGAFAAKAGGSKPLKAIIRVSFWGSVAMGLTALVGYMFGVSV